MYSVTLPVDDWTVWDTGMYRYIEFHDLGVDITIPSCGGWFGPANPSVQYIGPSMWWN